MYRVCRWSLITASLFIMMPLAVKLAFAAPDSHEIIQKLAVENYGTQTVLNGKSIQIPKGWMLKKKSDSSIAFVVPYHHGVTGGIELAEKALSVQESADLLSSAYKTDFRIDSVEQLNGGEKKGNKAILSGRFGGEICQVLIFTGELNSGNSVLFHAIVPSAWFNTYTQFLEDILGSLQ
ncbi:MAG: hypothetical protein IJM59_12790 [Proteobacteria bacterium]|nr:hypothetical protein [Pseudomonadota bacterium]